MVKWIPILLIFLCGCNSHKQWKTSAIKTRKPAYNSERLVYKVTNPFREVEIEFAKIDEMTLVYFNVHANQIPAYQGDPKKAVIHLHTHDREITLIADRLEGGQRLRLPPLASKHLIDALFSSETVTLGIDPYFETNLDTSPFKEKYKSYKRGERK